MTETTILDEGAVNEIEARPAYVNTRFEEMIILTLAERDALCATVKHLRAEVERGALCEECEQWEYNEDGSCRTFTVCGACWNALQSQLEQLRAENERLLRGDFTDEELQGFCHNLSERERDAFFEGCTKYQQRLFGTSVVEQVREENQSEL